MPAERRESAGGHAMRALALIGSVVVFGGLRASEPEPELRPAPGMLLVAQHDLPDPNFSETVVLILRYDPHGALGLVINRRSRKGLAELFPEWKIDEARDSLFLGGPVTEGEVFVLVRGDPAPEGAKKVLDGLYVTQSKPTLQRLLGPAGDGIDFRVYAGYAGWAPLQLDSEIDRGDWHLAPAVLEHVFHERPAELWHELVPDRPTDVALGSEHRRAEPVPGLPILLQTEP